MRENPPAYEKSVFINCPYDSEFEDLFLAIVFTVVSLGFVPRSARESEGRADTRISRIADAIANSKYSIHDLSRFTGQGVENLARFNMPLELGVAVALRHERQGSMKPHNWLVLVPGGYLYQKFVSDLAGFDPSQHELTATSVIREVYSWLRLQEDAIFPTPTAQAIWKAFASFKAEVVLRQQSALGRSIWPDILNAAAITVPGP